MTQKIGRNIILVKERNDEVVMRIITVSREFASGGREIGKRLADELGFDYYDREILTAVAEKSELDVDYVEELLERGLPKIFPLTFGRTFSYPDSASQNFTRILLAQQQIINDIAKKGRDFVIVGRSADVILSEYKTFNIFVYADMESKLRRCREREPDDRKLSDRDLIRMIKKIDAGRVTNREFVGNGGWGEKENYDLCLNTTNVDIKRIIPPLASYALDFFAN